MNYVAKVELFEPRWQGWILSRLGAFPIRRGESDEEAWRPRGGSSSGRYRLHLPRGHPDRRGSLAFPQRGVGRLALQTGAPVIPTACWAPNTSAAAGGSGPARSGSGSAGR